LAEKRKIAKVLQILILLVGKAEPVPEIVPPQIDLDEVLLASRTGREAVPA